MTQILFDRVVSDTLLASLSEEGSLRWVVDLVLTDETGLLDLQLRRDQRGSKSWATVYAGLTSLLDVNERKGKFWFTANQSHQARGGFDKNWLARVEEDQLPDGDDIRRYVEKALATIPTRHVNAEGRVHAALGRNKASFTVIQREASPAFSDQATKDQICGVVTGPIISGAIAADPGEVWWPATTTSAPRLGTSPDFVAVDVKGRVLVIEAKPVNATAGLRWAPAQLRTYAELWARLLKGEKAVERLRDMLNQRVTLGLAPAGADIADDPVVVPVLVVGPDAPSKDVEDQVELVAAAMPKTTLEPMDVVVLSSDVVPAPVIGVGSGFDGLARHAAHNWRLTAQELPAEARQEGVYRGRPRRFCLPETHAARNLLDGVREDAITYFAEHKVAWHKGIAGGPTNHLLSSQVQCVNALGAGLKSAAPVTKILNALGLDAAEVLPAESDENGFVAFEWVGAKDYLNERGGAAGQRGAHQTSADAFVRFRTSAGTEEAALIEWKYVEKYSHGPLSGGSKSNAIRIKRYGAALSAPDGPIELGSRTIEDLLVEPVYQLMRLSLLAHALEWDPDDAATRVHLIYAAPWGNTALMARAPKSLAEPGTSLLDAWRPLLRDLHRFHYLDTSRLVTDELVSDAFSERYAHLALS